ncbi:aminoacyl-histidine dipeptidase [Brumimicrobium aurantiacum]|uniref:Cytosol non-specific dipeptidase n=1 Tax=Brumimicrobium aurantiacum TaxID=1737063 RepID=A0A3E1EUP1_9FLAO|nr:aminoacyl-histidine dipeptidase [Brumimicrobium aurantiacum]RFC53222.1 aminoacyl-histidine dipeptidase [Brumimicrobium aurantiacum]
MSNEVKALAPKEIWENFANLNEVPRPSKKEERVIQFMVDFGKSIGLETTTDKIGNIIIKKPATEGMEDRQTVILQSHVDMVHQKNNDTDFDFDKEGIKMYVDGDWVKAKGTTLGADNGIGVATIMGLLASSDIPHPALEAMFTVDEETGMTGAKELDPSFYEGTILLNLDTEDDDEISIGCAGGIDTNTSYDYETVDSDKDAKAFKVEIKGLKGGHSGMDIDSGRANANKLMARFLIEADENLNLHEFNGGGLRNAIPREAVAIVSMSATDVDAFKQHLKTSEATFQEEYKPVETSIEISLSEVDTPAKMVANHEKKAMLYTINAVHNGVFKMSLNFDNLVETSSSLAQVIIKDGKFESKSLQRSSVESTKADVARTIRSVFDLLGADVEQTGDYPGWEPNPDSAILKTMREMYEKRFNEKPNVMACHAGLECGILGKHLPGVDMISFGPTIMHPHSPDEKVSISSVQKFWGFLLEVLKETPKK